MQEPTCYRYLDNNGQSPASPFMLPGVVAVTTEYATDGPGHEFPAGTTDFRDLDRNCLFLRIVRVAGSTAETHYTSKHTWEGKDGNGNDCTYGYIYGSGLTDFPSNFEMKINTSANAQDVAEFQQKTFSTGTPTWQTAGATMDGVGPHWVGDGRFIEMWSDQSSKIYYRHKVSSTQNTNPPTETSLLSSGSPGNTMKSSNQTMQPTSPDGWLLWTDTMNSYPWDRPAAPQRDRTHKCSCCFSPAPALPK